jgi:hypothetical protein
VSFSATRSFPVAVSPNGRYLVDQNGKPYMMVGDSPWSLAVNLSAAQQDAYFADRQARGFNTALVGVLGSSYIGGRTDLSTYDGVFPFTSGRGTSSDLATPNPAYWNRIDAMVADAASHGITLMLDPAETGALLPLLSSNGTTKDFNYGAFLGARYKNDPNVIWMSGNDYQQGSWGNDPYVTAVAKGILSAAPNHLQTVELDYYNSTSLDDANWKPIVTLNQVYTYYPTYAEVLAAYNEAALPVFLGEANYEFENNNGLDSGTPYVLRLQEYWTMTSGATGQLYGNHYTWHASSWSQEQANLDTPGATQIGYMKALFGSGPWWNLVPDQHHTFVTGGYGTFATGGSLASNNYVTAAITPDGSFAVVYLPKASTITVHMAQLKGPVTAKWFDPTTGSYATIGSYTNYGTQQFTSPPRHRDGSDDWVLVL